MVKGSSAKSQQARDLAATLRNHREEILGRWSTLCRENPKAQPMTEAELLDHLPRLLDRLATAAEHASEGDDTTSPTKESRAHALHRLEEGFDLTDITHEYALLRRVLFSIVAERAPHLVIGGFDVVGNAIDDSLSESVEYYVQVRHRTLEALDQIAQIAAGPGELDGILRRLLHVTMQTIPSVDGVTLLLRRGDVLEVKAALGVMAERDPGFTIKVGEGFAGSIARSGEPMLLSAAETSPIVQSDFIRQQKIKALYGVPMVRGAEIIGVAHMASKSAVDFADEDKLLFRTITERATAVITQAELMSRERAWRLFLETVIGNIKEGVAVADQDGKILLASEGAARIFGVTLEELRGMHAQEFQRFAPKGTQGESRTPALVEALHGVEVPPHERVITDSHGEQHALIVSATPVRDGVRGAVVIFTDVTDRHRMEEELRTTANFRERMMALVSHDLRTPLSAISLASQYILKRDDAPGWAVASAERVKRSAEKMQRMISDLLDFTRTQARGSLPIQRHRVDLCAIVNDAMEELDVAHRGRVKLEIQCSHVVGLWDRDRLAQLVGNLVNNAIEHGSPDAPIEIHVTDLGSEARLSVTNRGETISAARLPTLFAPFHGTSGERRGSGLGLGLHIVSEIAKAHGGSATAESANGVTTFAVTIPKGM